MTLTDFVKVIRNHWITVVATTLVTILLTVGYTLTQTPMYQASTRLFVSTTSGSTMAELYNANRLSQDRVLSYAELVMGLTLAQRTIDRLDLNMSAADLSARVTAKSQADTVLIDVFVRDASPVQARDIASALSDEFVVMVAELETPMKGARPDARVVVEQRATIPTTPVTPKKFRNLILGVLLGAMLGIGIAVLRDLLDNTVKNQEQLEAVAGTGVVGFIPFDKALHQIPTISFDSDTSGTAEALRKLRTNLQFLAVDKPPRLIVFTSASPSEGKTTTSINIALALAEARHNVLLIDGDLRRPRLAKYLDVVGSVGFSTALSGAASLDDVLQKSKFPFLTVLTSGPTPPNPSELLGSLVAKKLLSELRGRFDYVIIDSAPLLAVTDSAILAAEADGAIMVVRAGKTKRDQVAHAVGMLRDVGAPLLGAVLSMMPTRGNGAYNYYYYYGTPNGDPQTAGLPAKVGMASNGSKGRHQADSNLSSAARPGSQKQD